MGMDDAAIQRRLKSVSARDIDPGWPNYASLVAVEIDAKGKDKPAWRRDVDRSTRDSLILQWLMDLPYHFA